MLNIISFEDYFDLNVSLIWKGIIVLFIFVWLGRILEIENVLL